MPLCVYIYIYIYNDENNATCVNVYAQVSQQLRVECYCLLFCFMPFCTVQHVIFMCITFYARFYLLHLRTCIKT